MTERFSGIPDLEKEYYVSEGVVKVPVHPPSREYGKPMLSLELIRDEEGRIKDILMLMPTRPGRFVWRHIKCDFSVLMLVDTSNQTLHWCQEHRATVVDFYLPKEARYFVLGRLYNDTTAMAYPLDRNGRALEKWNR